MGGLKEATTITAAKTRTRSILDNAVATFKESPLPVRLLTYSVVGGGTIAILSGCGAQSQPCEILPTVTPDKKGGSCPITIFSYNPKQIVSLEDQASLKKSYGADIKSLYQWVAVNKGSGTENKGDGNIAFSTYTFENERSMVVFPSGKEDYNSGESEAHEYTTSWFETADGKILYSYNYKNKLNPGKAISFFSIEYKKPDGATLEELVANPSKLGNPSRVIISNPPANEEIIYNIDSQNPDDKKLIEAISSLFVREAHALGEGIVTPLAPTKTPATPIAEAPTIDSKIKDAVGEKEYNELNASIGTNGEIKGMDYSTGKPFEGMIKTETITSTKTADWHYKTIINGTAVAVTDEGIKIIKVAWNPDTNSWISVVKLNAEATTYDQYTYIADLQNAVENGDLDLIILSQGGKDNHPYADPFNGNPPSTLYWINMFRGLSNKELRYMYLSYAPSHKEYNPGWEEGRFVEGNLPWRFAPTVRGKTDGGADILSMINIIPNSLTGNIIEHLGLDKASFEQWHMNYPKSVNLVDYLHNKNPNGISDFSDVQSTFIVPVFPFPAGSGGWDPVSGRYGGMLANYSLPDVGGLQKQGDFFDLLASYPGVQDGIRNAVADGDIIEKNSLLLEGGISPELAKFLSRHILFPSSYTSYPPF